MESTGVAGAIQMSYAFLKSLGVREDWNTLTRGLIQVKGKGGTMAAADCPVAASDNNVGFRNENFLFAWQARFPASALAARCFSSETE